MQIETTTINGREYTVRKSDALAPAASAHLIARGFDGSFYSLTGKRGAVYMAYFAVESKTFEIVCSMR